MSSLVADDRRAPFRVRLCFCVRAGARLRRERRRAGELAVTCAWIANKDDVRTLIAAERWRIEVVPSLLDNGAVPSWTRQAMRLIASVFVKHPVDVWLERHGKDLPKKARKLLLQGYISNYRETREVIDAWHRLPNDVTPADHAIATLRRVYRHGPAIRRDILALQSGEKFEVPFDTLVVFSTNFHPNEIFDQAALRRIFFKIKIDGPGQKDFLKIFALVAKKKGLPLDEASLIHLLQVKYPTIDNVYANYQPVFLIDQILSICAFEGVAPRMTPDYVDRAWANMFVKDEKIVK